MNGNLKPRWYVGLRLDCTGKCDAFRALWTPTEKTHGKCYGAVIGPFRTKRGAMFMASRGRNNPHCITVADAERLAARFVR